MSATNQKSEIRNQKSGTVLLAVTGMSPAVLTETVWALAHPPRGREPIVPREVVVITTSPGAAQLQRELLEPRTDWHHRSVWESLRASLLSRRTPRSRPSARASGLGVSHAETPLQLCAPRVIELPDEPSGVKRPASDLRSAEDNEAAADFILEEVRRIVENPDTHLIASIAGGRKTMGALLYAALSLLGRQTDRVTHVLVNEPFDQCRGFFFPDQPVQEVTTGTGKDAVRCGDAHIELAEIPFVPLRNLFERQFVRRPGGFRSLVNRCQERVNDLAGGSVQLELSTGRTGVKVNGIPVPLSPLQHLLMLFLAGRLDRGEPAIEKYCLVREPLEVFAQIQYSQRSPQDFSDWRQAARLPGDFDDQRLRKVLDEIRGKLRRAGPVTAALIPRLPIKGRFSLDLPSGAVKVRP